MAVTDHYGIWKLDPEEEMSDFPNTWNFNVDKIDAAIYEAATDDITVSRLPDIPASKIATGRFPEARLPKAIFDRLDELENSTRESGRREIGGLMINGNGRIYLERRGSSVLLNLYGVTPDGEPSNALVQLFGSSGFPSGFRPATSWSGPCGYTGTSSIAGIPRLYMNSGGRLAINNPGATLYGQYSYFTNDAWPSTLPGDPS